MALRNVDAGQVTIADYGAAHGSGINREDLSNLLTLIAQTQTPLMQASASTTATHTQHDWPEDSLTDPKTAHDTDVNSGSLVMGNAEGGDYTPGTMTVPLRRTNTCQIYRRDTQVSRTQIRMNPAAIRNTFAHTSRKVMQELTRAGEARAFSVVFRAGNATETAAIPRLERTLEGFTNDADIPTGNVKTLGAVDAPGSLQEDDVLDVMESMADEGSPAVVLYASAPVKRKISRTFTGIGNAGAEAPMSRQVPGRTIVATVQVYESEFGNVKLVWNPWVTKEVETVFEPDLGATITQASATADGGLAAGTGYGVTEVNGAGRVWMFSQGNVRFPWLDRLHTESIGKRGDSISGITVGEGTLEVGSTKGLGVVRRVSNS